MTANCVKYRAGSLRRIGGSAIVACMFSCAGTAMC
jgi:hypothetical protein